MKSPQGASHRPPTPVHKSSTFPEPGPRVGPYSWDLEPKNLTPALKELTISLVAEVRMEGGGIRRVT